MFRVLSILGFSGYRFGFRVLGLGFGVLMFRV